MDRTDILELLCMLTSEEKAAVIIFLREMRETEESSVPRPSDHC